MQRNALVVVLVALFAAVTLAQSDAPQPVHVVNLPPVQPVTGSELIVSQELLTLLLVHSSGFLPRGYSSPEVDECLVTGGEMHEVESVTISVTPGDCDLGSYTGACATAARRARSQCESTCAAFPVLGAHRSCRGRPRPVIERFWKGRHCLSEPERPTQVTCVVTGWCSCDP